MWPVAVWAGVGFGSQRPRCPRLRCSVPPSRPPQPHRHPAAALAVAVAQLPRLRLVVSAPILQEWRPRRRLPWAARAAARRPQRCRPSALAARRPLPQPLPSPRPRPSPLALPVLPRRLQSPPRLLRRRRRPSLAAAPSPPLTARVPRSTSASAPPQRRPRRPSSLEVLRQRPMVCSAWAQHLRARVQGAVARAQGGLSASCASSSVLREGEGARRGRARGAGGRRRREAQAGGAGGRRRGRGGSENDGRQPAVGNANGRSTTKGEEHDVDGIIIYIARAVEHEVPMIR